MFAPAIALAVTMIAPQLPPPNLVENGDARAGEIHWEASRRERGTVESCNGSPCFVMRNGAGWMQFIPLPPESTGKFVVLVARASTERVLPDRNITGLPYINGAFATATRRNYLYVPLRDSRTAHPPRENYWMTISDVLTVPRGAAYIWLSLGQGQRKGTPHNGSAARVRDVEARMFDTLAAADAYIRSYDRLYEPGK
jgi:hypothetical protein